MPPLSRRGLLEATLAMSGLSLTTFAQERVVTAAVVSRPGESRVPTGGPFVFKVSSADSGGRFTILESGVVAPPLHRHLHQEEWFYVVQGEFGFQVGAEKFRIAAGGSVLGPRNVPHGFVNLSGAAGKLLIMFQPPGQMEPFFKELSSLLVGGRMPSPERLVDVNRRHGIESAGPPLTPQDFA